MNYIDKLAQDIKSRVDPAVLPKSDTDALFRIYAVLALAKGVSTSAEDVHNAWSAWMSSRQPDRPSIVPFDQLSHGKQREDDPFVEAIHAAVVTMMSSKPAT